jgi:hypothetical protein
MSRSPIVDNRYRLTSADLNGRPRQVVVKAVTMEGVEIMTPVLHFEGVARPLALGLAQRTDMALIARSTLTTDWVGVSLVLLPSKADGQEIISLQSIDARRATPYSAWKPRQDKPTRSLRGALVLVLLVVIAFLGVYVVESTELLNRILELLSG